MFLTRVKKRLVVLSSLAILAGVSQVRAQDYEGFIGGNFMLVEAIDAPRGYCLDLEGYAFTTDTSAPVIVHSCKEGFWKDGTWMVDFPSQGQIYLPDFELCAAAASADHDAEVVLVDCAQTDLNRFVFRDDGKVELIADAENTLCLAVGETSRPTGANLRRQTRVADCVETDDQYMNWVVPREDTVYPGVNFVASAEALARAVGGAMGAGAMSGAMAMGGMAGGAGNNQFVGACSPCHGTAGEGHISEFSPKLSGQEDWYLTRQINNFKNNLRGVHDGERWAKQMNFHMQEFSDAQIESFVEYIMTFEDTPAEITISGDVARGETLYAQSCVACHGAEGMGNVALNSPRVAGMADWYMVRQLQNFRNGHRGEGEGDLYGQQMVPFAKVLPDEQALLDVVSYINTLARE